LSFFGDMYLPFSHRLLSLSTDFTWRSARVGCGFIARWFWYPWSLSCSSFPNL